MSKFNAGKASVLALTAVGVLSAFLLGKSLTSVAAERHNDHDDHNWVTCHKITGNHCSNQQFQNRCEPTWSLGECNEPTQTPTPTRTPHNDCDKDDNWCKTSTPTPTPTPTTTPVVTSTPTATPDGDVCHNIDGIQTAVPEGSHLDAGNVNCVSFAVPGEQTGGSTGGQVLGASTSKGQVLGASTMAGTGSFAETLYGAIMGLGAALTSFGIKKTLRKAK